MEGLYYISTVYLLFINNILGMSIVSHNWLELLIRILHVAQTEIKAICKGLVVEGHLTASCIIQNK